MVIVDWQSPARAASRASRNRNSILLPCENKAYSAAIPQTRLVWRPHAAWDHNPFSQSRASYTAETKLSQSWVSPAHGRIRHGQASAVGGVLSPRHGGWDKGGAIITLAYALSRSCMRNLTNDMRRQGNASKLPADAGTGSGLSQHVSGKIWLPLCIQYQGALLGRRPCTERAICLYMLIMPSNCHRIRCGDVLR